MYEKSGVITNSVGLHARPASSFAMKAQTFKSEIKIRKESDKNEYNAKSLLKLMALGACRGDVVIVNAEGEDEKAAVEELVKFLSENCGENV